jgi:hypothetical protein
MKSAVFAILLGSTYQTSSTSVLRHWSVTTENNNRDGTRIVFTLIGLAQSAKLPVLLLSYRSDSWNAVLTCGERLGNTTAKLAIAFDGKNQFETWRVTPDQGAAFTTEPENFIVRLLGCHYVEVEFPVANERRHAVFDVSGLDKEIGKFPEAKKALTQREIAAGTFSSGFRPRRYRRLSSNRYVNPASTLTSMRKVRKSRCSRT